MKLKVPEKIVSLIQRHSPLITIPILCMAFLYGVVVPKDFDIYKKVGFFIVRPYRYGVYLTQQNSQVFYNVSPYQAYFLNGNNKELLLNWSNPVYSQESELIFNPQNKYKNISNTALSYFKFMNPKATFKSGDRELVIGTKATGNKVYFTLEKNTFSVQNGKPVFLTLSFNPEDTIYDENGSVYSINTDEETINDLKVALGINLIRAVDPEGYKNSKLLTIFNPELNGSIKIPVLNENQRIVNIDQVEYVIEFETLSKDYQKPYIEVEI